MTEAEIYEFDLNGYIVYREMLSPEEVRRSGDILGDCPQEKTPYPHYPYSFGFMERDSFFMDLMARPRTLWIIRHMLNNWLRLDHAYGIEMTRSSEASGHLTTGSRSDHGQHEYQWVSAYPPGDAPPNPGTNGRMYTA